MANMSLSDCLCYITGKTFRKMLRCYGPHIKAYKLTVSQLFILLALYEKDEATPNELSGKLALNSSTLTGILDRLEKKGLLKRELNSKDRRSIIVKLTEKAKTLKDGLWEAYETVNGEFLSVLSKEEHKTLLNVLGRLENRSQEMHKEENEGISYLL
jgi:DNA-binding MarR family transcriptional regulator